jgi:hypothetical protein
VLPVARRGELAVLVAPVARRGELAVLVAPVARRGELAVLVAPVVAIEAGLLVALALSVAAGREGDGELREVVVPPAHPGMIVTTARATATAQRFDIHRAGERYGLAIPRSSGQALNSSRVLARGPRADVPGRAVQLG